MKLFRRWMFEWWEVSLLKLCLLSLGIILGILFAEYLDTFMILWWLLFIVTAVYFVLRMLREQSHFE